MRRKTKKKPRTNILLESGSGFTSVMPSNKNIYYIKKAGIDGLSIAEMRDVTSRIRNNHMTAEEVQQILEKEPSSIIKQRIRAALKKKR